MSKYLFIILLILPIYLVGCTNNTEHIFVIKGHLIEASTGQSLSNIKISFSDDSKIYAITMSDENGLFTLVLKSLRKNHKYTISFLYDDEYPPINMSLINIPNMFDLQDVVVFDKTNPYGYKRYLYDGKIYMIHNTLQGVYTYIQAKETCYSLQAGGYSDWVLPEADMLDDLANDSDLAKLIAEDGWYWTSWIFSYTTSYYYICNLHMDDVSYTSSPDLKLKVLPVRIDE